MNMVLLFGPLTEEGLMIGMAIVAILIVVGFIFGVFDWITTEWQKFFNIWGTP